MVTLKTTCSDWGWHDEQRSCPEPPSQRWSPSCDGGCVPVSDSEDGARNEASELKGLPKGTFALTVRLEVARAELVACCDDAR